MGRTNPGRQTDRWGVRKMIEEEKGMKSWISGSRGDIGMHILEGHVGTTSGAQRPGKRLLQESRQEMVLA